MEISLDKFTNALNHVVLSKVNVELNAMLDSIEYNNIDDILRQNRNQPSNQHFRFTEIVQQAFFKSQYNNIDDELVLVIASGAFYLNSAIENNDISHLLRFLHLNLYLNARIDLIIIHLNKSRNKGLTTKILWILSNFKFELSILPGAPEHEVELKLSADKAYIEDNLHGYYSFIYSLEQGVNRSIVPPIVKSLFSFFLDYDYDACIEYIIAIQSQIPFIIYFHRFRSDQLIKIGLDGKSNNHWLLLEILRQLSRKTANEYSNHDIRNIALIINRLYELNLSFYEQSIVFFHSNTIINAALGLQLYNLNKITLKHIVANIFQINDLNTHKESKEILLKNFRECASVEMYNYFLELVYEKWLNFLTECANDDKFYANSVIETDYYDYIIENNVNNLTSDKLAIRMDLLFSKLLWLDSEWFKSSSNQTTRFFIYFSELHALSFAYSKHKVISNIVRRQLDNFIICNLIYKRYFTNSYSRDELIRNCSI